MDTYQIATTRVVAVTCSVIIAAIVSFVPSASAQQLCCEYMGCSKGKTSCDVVCSDDPARCTSNVTARIFPGGTCTETGCLLGPIGIELPFCCQGIGGCTSD